MTKAVIFIALSAIATAFPHGHSDHGDLKKQFGRKVYCAKHHDGHGPKHYNKCHGLAETLSFYITTRNTPHAAGVKRMILEEIESIDRPNKWDILFADVLSNSGSLSYTSALYRKNLIAAFVSYKKEDQVPRAKKAVKYYEDRASNRKITPQGADFLHELKEWIEEHETSETHTSFSDENNVRIWTASRSVAKADAAFQEQEQKGPYHGKLSEIEQLQQEKDRFATATKETAFAAGMDRTATTGAFEAEEHNLHTGESAKAQGVEHFREIKQAAAAIDSSSDNEESVEGILDRAEKYMEHMGMRMIYHANRNGAKLPSMMRDSNDVVIV